MRIAVVGSGFAGSLLARVLCAEGHEVVLVERGTHPRFAVGESSTPLAAICLERLATRYDCPDLHSLAAHGRWLRDLPHLRRGLKRGFTFYSHRPGRPYANEPNNDRRLLVAASPNDAIADAHWVRADVDHHFVQLAQHAGAEYHDRVELREVVSRNRAWRLAGQREGTPFDTSADFVIDATGPAGFVAKQLGISSAMSRINLRTRVVYGHFSAVGDFVALAQASGAAIPVGPYPDQRAAVHHMIDEGWLYVLPFDDGLVSAGFVLERNAVPVADNNPSTLWHQLLARYPTIEEQFGEAHVEHPIAVLEQTQHRLARAGGRRWAALPPTFSFVSPMCSTGIAWSLLGVERLAMAFENATQPDDLDAPLERYANLLGREADHVTRLIEGAYPLRRSFEVFAEYTNVYFAAASFAEASQRLLDRPEHGEHWAWEGFLGATDPVVKEFVGIAADRARHAARSHTPDSIRHFADEVQRLIDPRNLAGLANPSRNRLYPVDLDALVAAAPLLGLTAGGIRAALPRLRGTATW